MSHYHDKTITHDVKRKGLINPFTEIVKSLGWRKGDANYRVAYNQFIKDFPEFLTTSKLDHLRKTEYGRLDAEKHVYLDYTGGGLYAESQVSAHANSLKSTVFGNPHSINPSSRKSTILCEESRNKVLTFFNANPEEYMVIFTPNASGAIKIVGESYPFEAELLLCDDNHNSVNGLREFAKQKGAEVNYVRLNSELRVDNDDLINKYLRKPLQHSELSNRLFAYPAQSNFSGNQHPLEWIEAAHVLGWDVLVDCAAFAPTNRLDLSKYKPDFVPLSFYKIFGYPTGLGCLIVKKTAFHKLVKPWFAGGTVWTVSTHVEAQSATHILSNDFSRFEDGTIDYLSIPSLNFGLDWITSIGIDTIHTRSISLTGWLLHAMKTMRPHSTGVPMLHIYGAQDTSARGGNICFEIWKPNGKPLDDRIVATLSAKANISLRTGCFCNPGSAIKALTIGRGGPDLYQDEKYKLFWQHSIEAADSIEKGMLTMQEYLDTYFNMKDKGFVVRVSVGIATTFKDVYTFMAFLEGFRDKMSFHCKCDDRAGCP